MGEREGVVRALTEQHSKLLLRAARRDGKTALVREAARAAREAGTPAVVVELKGISCVADVASRLLVAAALELGRSWPEAPSEIGKRLGVRVFFEDAGEGRGIVPRLDPALRRIPSEEQQPLIRRALDAMDDLARSRSSRIGIALEDVHELFRLGGGAADWALAGGARQHANLMYVLTADTSALPLPPGSESSPLSLFETLSLAPIPPLELGEWIDRQLRQCGIRPNDVGSRIVRIAGNRLGDVVQLSAYCFDGVRSSGYIADDDVEYALEALLDTAGPLIESAWGALTPHQQNVLRALAVSSTGLTTGATRERFGLGDTGTTHNSAQLLVRKGLIARLEDRYVFDSPFFRAWVISRALADVGLFLPVTHPVRQES